MLKPGERKLRYKESTLVDFVCVVRFVARISI